MCGIFGFIAAPNSSRRKKSVQICMNGLEKLEYRGYDSAGIAGTVNGQIKSLKSVGKIKDLRDAVHSNQLELEQAIAHTRWATHGKRTHENAHPHIDEKRTLALVHNGIIENHFSLKQTLEATGIHFTSETDSEVIVQLISYYYSGDLLAALLESLSLLQGSYAIAMIHKDHPNSIIAAARDCPLVIGISPNKKEVFLSSDLNAFSEKSLEVFFLADDEIAFIHPDRVDIYNRKGLKIYKEPEHYQIDHKEISKGNFEHFMLKEIFEQPRAIQQTLCNRYSEEFGTAHFEELGISPHELQSAQHILILACGTSWHAGCVGASMLEQIARIPSQAEIASEFRYTNPIVSEKTLVIAISQSGETADTIAAVREAKAKGAKILSICNSKHSTLDREADSCLLLRAGPEISVCSTKAFSCQVALLSLFTLYMARLRHMSKEEGQSFLRELLLLPDIASHIIHRNREFELLAERMSKFENFFFLGRRYMYHTSLEAALKLKEISYLNAYGYPAGELKHGPIALISPELLTIALCGNKQTYTKLLSNLFEIKARGGPILAFASKGAEELEEVATDIFYLPDGVRDELLVIPYAIASQLFAYYIAKKRNLDIDKPRNLAKSVTVE